MHRFDTERYEEYLDQNSSLFGAIIWEWLGSNWYFDFSNPKANHDTHLEKFTYHKLPNKTTECELLILGSYWDRWITFHYHNVSQIKVLGGNLADLHEWHIDELTLSEGHYIHEIFWTNGLTLRIHSRVYPAGRLR